MYLEIYKRFIRNFFFIEIVDYLFVYPIIICKFAQNMIINLKQMKDLVISFWQAICHPIRTFDRTFSEKTGRQLLWLIAIFLIVFAILCLVADSSFFGYSSFGTEVENMGKDRESTGYGTANWTKLVLTLMLDPGQIDHIDDSSPAHTIAIVFAFVGILLVTGLTLSTFTNIVQRRVNSFLNGEVRYKKFKDHFVIIGFGELSTTIIEQLIQKYKGNCRILLMSSGDAKEIRRTINTIIEKKYEKNITIYRGRKDTIEDIESLCIPKAKEVFLIGEESELNRDASNIEALQKIVSSIKKDENKHKVKDFVKSIISSTIQKICQYESYDKINHIVSSFKQVLIIIRKKIERRKIPVMVLFEYQTTYAAFQITDISEDWKNNYIDFRPFNYYENWAKKLLYTRKYKDIDTDNSINKIEEHYPSLDRTPITENSDQHVHLVIFSMSRMGVALGTFAAQVCHFPNFATKGIKTRITFITPEADTEAYFFRGRYSRFFEVAPSFHNDYISNDPKVKGKEYTEHPKYAKLEDMLDIEFEFIKGKAEQPEIRKLLSDWAIDEKQILSIAVCLKDPSKNMAIGLYLPDIIFKRKISVFVRQKSSGALLTQLRSNSKRDSYNKFSNIYPFGMQDNCYDLESEEIVKAQLFNSFYYNVYDKEFTKGDLMDVINSKWQKLKISHQWSNLYSVYSVKFKLNSLIQIKDESQGIDYEKYSSLLHCDKDEKCNFLKIGEKTELMAEVEHNRWNVEKLLLGYRVYTSHERGKDDLALKVLEKYMKENKLSYADFEYYENNNIKNSHMQEYVKLKKMRKGNENTDFAHNAIRPYKELDESNKRYDRFMTGNIPEILRLYDKISADNIRDEDMVIF